MKRKRFSVEQIVAIVTQAQMGMPVAELIRRVGISEQTFYRCKKQFTGLEIDQVRQLKQLQTRMADSTGCAAKKLMKPSRCRALAETNRRPLSRHRHLDARYRDEKSARTLPDAHREFRLGKSHDLCSR